MSATTFASGLAAALIGTPELAGIVDPEIRGMVAREIAHRVGFKDGGPALPVAGVIAAVRAAEPWWWSKPTDAAQPQPHTANPWKTGNLTQQCKTLNENPTLAARMQAEAGR